MDVTYDALKTYECTKCHAQKTLKDFSPSMLKDWLRGQPNYFRWVCYDCQYPLCKLCVESNDPVLQRRRPRDAIKHNALIDNVYYCQDHKYPRCNGILCSKLKYAERKTRCMSTKNRFKTWSCDECPQASSDMASRSNEKECVSCKISKPLDAFSKDVLRQQRHHWVCESCRFPACAKCGVQNKDKVKTRTEDEYTCGLCYNCDHCGQWFRPNQFQKNVLKNHKYLGRILKCKSCHPGDRRRST